MAKKFHRLAGWMNQLGDLPKREQSRMRDFIFTHCMLSVASMKQLIRTRESYIDPACIRRYGKKHCQATLDMIDGYIALREMGLTKNTYYSRRKRRHSSGNN